MPRKRLPSTEELEKIVPPKLPGGEAAVAGDVSNDAEAREYENKAKSLANAHSELQNQELSDRLAQRKHYAKYTFFMVAAWLSSVLALIMLQGFNVFGNHLSDKVLAALIGSTTINVIGMLAIILHGLYPESRK